MEEFKVEIKFWDLGRSKAKGEFKTEGIAEEINKNMCKEFSKYLMSSDINFDEGTIYVSFRSVGKYILVGKIKS